AESDPELLDQAITRYGVIGHAQTSATARRGGKPVILRRDFDTTDGGLAGLHFVSLQPRLAALHPPPRRGAKPVILRRDFDTTDGGLAGLHFVSLQRSIADFVATRTAMNATS